MGRRDFKAHLAEARTVPGKIKAREDVGVLHLEAGELEGQLSFQYAHASLDCPLSITVMVQDTAAYPRSIGYILFLNNDLEGDLGSRIPNMLDKLSPSLEDIPIDDIFPHIAAKLDQKLTEGSSSDVGGQSSSDEFDDTAFSGSEYDDLDPRASPSEQTNSAELTGSLETQRKDLTAALAAGLSVGVYDSGDTHHGIISLSIPVSKWGMNPERLQAWDLTENDHVVLLIKVCAGRYPSTESYLELSRQSLYRFVLGKCATAKPSPNSARDAVRDRSSASEARSEPTVSAENSKYAEFQPLYLFNSVQETLQNDLASLIKIRLEDDSISWSGALTSHMTGEKAVVKPSQEEGPENSAGPRILRQHTLGSAGALSIPLVAMNCALYLMVRSGQHCVNCGRPLPVGFETMRPYICDRDLCLDQYFSLNLGPGIEHEIVNNPHTVDLLVGFFYSALLSNRVSRFPKTLRLKAPGSAVPDQPDVKATIQYLEEKGEAKLLGDTVGREKTWLKPGAKILLLAVASLGPDQLTQQGHIPQGTNSLTSRQWSTGRATGRAYHHSQRLLCTVIEVCGHAFTFKADAYWNGSEKPVYASTAPIVGPAFQPSLFVEGSTKLPSEMFVLPFTQDIGDLTQGERDMALFTILCGLPSILSIRKFLLQNPGHRLASSAPIIDAVTYRLLLWIVASSRSFIVQDEPVPDLTQLQSQMDAPNRVVGMPKGWLQFRFIQGSPEKEHRFAQQLGKALDGDSSTELNIPKQPKSSTGLNYSTRPKSLFAWHGSSLHNWHGIVSTGLNFEKTANGRSYGHGVYFSEHFGCSITYAHQSAEPSWPNSDLRASQAISMCEIVNRKDDFVSQQPHMVVDKLDWIQCRFLFARVHPTTAATDSEVRFPQGSKLAGTSTSSKFLEDTSILNDENKPLKIPTSAIPSRAVNAARQKPSKSSWHSKSKRRSPGSEAPQPGLDDDAAIDLEGIDLDGVLSTVDVSLPAVAPACSKRLKEDPEVTDFVPGLLDWKLIPKLPDPVLPSTSALKILMQEFKAISKVQAEANLAERGWYVDLGKLEDLGNMFHWVVELHSFNKDLPLASDMERKGCKSIVLELNFGSTYPMSPPFARIIRPRFLEFAHGGGGNVTQGGSICSEMLVTQGWSPTMGVEKIILQIRLQLCDMERPARLKFGNLADSDYTVGEALEAYKRAAAAHGWSVSPDLDSMSAQLTAASSLQ